MPTPEEQAAQAAEAEAQAAAAAAAQEKQPPEDVASLKAQLEKERAERKAANAEAHAHRKRLREFEEQKKKAEEEALAQSGKFKELAEAREKRAKELEAELEQSRARLAEVDAKDAEEKAKRATQVANDFAALPEDLRSGIGADDLRSQEIAINAFRVAQGQKPRTPSIPATTPKPQGGSGGAPPYTASQLSAFNQIIGNPRAPAAKREEARVALAKAKDWRAQRGG